MPRKSHNRHRPQAETPLTPARSFRDDNDPRQRQTEFPGSVMVAYARCAAMRAVGVGQAAGAPGSAMSWARPPAHKRQACDIARLPALPSATTSSHAQFVAIATNKSIPPTAPGSPGQLGRSAEGNVVNFRRPEYVWLPM
jgi:hypothetical protein